jgi:Flp pilus assembly protein TadG
MRPSCRAARSRHRSRGQSLAEFAIVFPIFMLLVGGIIQFGMIFWVQNTLNQVVRDTGRWASTQTECDTPANRAAILATANDIADQSFLIGGNIGAADLTVSWTAVTGTCPPTDNQDLSWVSITIEHNAPIFFPFVPGSGAISASTEFRMEPKPQ